MTDIPMFDKRRACAGLLLRLGLGAALSIVVLAFMAVRLVPAIPASAALHAVDAATLRLAVALAPLALLAVACLCVVPLLSGAQSPFVRRVSVSAALASTLLFAIGLASMVVRRSVTPLLTVSTLLFCIMAVHVLLAAVKTVAAWVGHGRDADPARLTFLWGVIVFVFGLLVR